MTTLDFDPAYVTWGLTDTDLRHLGAAIVDADEVVIDLETTGLAEYAWSGGPQNGGYPARIVLVSLTLPTAGVAMPTTWVVPLSHPDSVWLGRWREVITRIAGWLKAAGRPILNQNLKFDFRWLYAHTGVDLSHLLIWDTLVSSHLLDENASTKLKERAPATFDVSRWDDFDLSTPGAAERVPIVDLGLYAARDTFWTWRLASAHRERMFLSGEGDQPASDDEVEDARLGRLAVWCAMPTMSTLTAIEQRGMVLDRDWVVDQLGQHQTEAEVLSAKLANRYGFDEHEASFAPTSLWFRDWTTKAIEDGQLTVAEMTPNGNPRWSKGVLIRQARLGSEVAADLLELRNHTKKSEFLTSWLVHVDPTGVIHSTYNYGRVVTGRLSCVTADTLIDMPRDMTRHPDGVPITEVRPGDWVYAFDHRRELTLRQVSWVGQTGVKPTVVVLLRNSHGHERTVRCTPEHLIRLRSGDYRHAERLRPGDAVMPMVRRGFHTDGHGGYLQFFPHSIARGNGQRSGGKNREHRWITEQIYGRRLSTKTDVHHLNGTMLDNTPSNLRPMTMAEHRSFGGQHPRRGEQREQPTIYLGPNDYRVVSVSEGQVEPVWDMTVPEDHCFVANGIVVHNSSDPNMQQVTSSLKPAFVPRPGHVFIDLDYSQVELRVAAFISRCEPMLEALRRGDDLHRLLAARITGKDPADVLPSERHGGKSANFGLLYAMSAAGFQTYAETVYGVVFTEEEAIAVRAAFFDTWVGIADWHAQSIARAHRTGQVTSPIGRVRRLPDIWDGNDYLSSAAERQAINSPVQGFASDLMQMAAASIEGRLPGVDPVPGAAIVATVHDDIVVEAPTEDWKRIALDCQDRMTTIGRHLRRLDCDLDVPLTVGVTVGTRWGLDDVGALG